MSLVALILSSLAVAIGTTNLVILARRNKHMFGRYFPPGPPKGWRP